MFDFPPLKAPARPPAAAEPEGDLPPVFVHMQPQQAAQALAQALIRAGLEFGAPQTFSLFELWRFFGAPLPDDQDLCWLPHLRLIIEDLIRAAGFSGTRWIDPAPSARYVNEVRQCIRLDANPPRAGRSVRTFNVPPQAVQVPIQQLQAFDLNAAETASRAQVEPEARAEFDRAAAEAASESAAFSTPSDKVHPPQKKFDQPT